MKFFGILRGNEISEHQVTEIPRNPVTMKKKKVAESYLPFINTLRMRSLLDNGCSQSSE